MDNIDINARAPQCKTRSSSRKSNTPSSWNMFELVPIVILIATIGGLYLLYKDLNDVKKNQKVFSQTMKNLNSQFDNIKSKPQRILLEEALPQLSLSEAYEDAEDDEDDEDDDDDVDYEIDITSGGDTEEDSDDEEV